MAKPPEYTPEQLRQRALSGLFSVVNSVANVDDAIARATEAVDRATRSAADFRATAGLSVGDIDRWRITDTVTTVTTADTVPITTTTPVNSTNNVVLWTCECGLGFTDVNAYNSHQETHQHVLRGTLYICALCGHRCYGELAFNAHRVLIHPPAQPVPAPTTRIPGLKYLCSLCEWEALDFDAVQKHIALAHSLNANGRIRTIIKDPAKIVTPTTPVKAKKTGHRPDRSDIIADDFIPDDDIEINF
jgi:hypothetical protein